VKIDDANTVIENPSWNDNDDKMTFAMFLADKKVPIPKEF